MINVTEDARQLLIDLSLYQVPIDPIIVCAKLGVIYNEKPYEGFDGTLMTAPGTQLISVNSNIRESGRRAFTCAHELGHYHYDLDNNKTSNKCSRDATGHGSYNSDEKEIRANEFASELLMPREFFLSEIQNREPSWQLIEELSGKFKTSLQATTNRFVKLTHHFCWLVVVKNRKLQRFTKADHNKFTPNLRGTFNAPKVRRNDWLPDAAENWLYENRQTKGKEVLCWPLPENQYGESLVLLWDENNTLLNEEDGYEDEIDRLNF